MTITYQGNPIPERYDLFKPSLFYMTLLAIVEMSQGRPIPKAVIVKQNLDEVLIKFFDDRSSIVLREDEINRDPRCRVLGLYYL